MHRNLGLAVVAVLAAAALLGSTASAARPTARSAQQDSSANVNLTMWWWGEQEAAGAKKWLAETVKLYEKKHPNVTIKTVLQTTDGLDPGVQGGRGGEEGPRHPVLLGRDLVARRRLGSATRSRSRTTSRHPSSVTT